MKQTLFLILILIIGNGFRKAEKPAIDKIGKRDLEVKISKEEIKLYNMINSYRKSKRLQPIPLSKSLTYVAQQHCKDLTVNKPDLKKGCNAHSWSENAKWTSCCYTIDHKEASCMWDKPKEMTNYEAYGFEIACGSSEPIYKDFVMTANYALESWKTSYHHNNVIVNKDVWKEFEWKAIGIGIYEGFASVWVGTSVDKEGKPTK